MSKSSLSFKKDKNYTCKYFESFQDSECKFFRVLFLYETVLTVKFSNLH